MADKIPLQIDAEAEIRIERVRTHLPAGNDLTLIALKGHLLAEEALDDLIRFYCKQPEHLDDVEIRFLVKARIARALVRTHRLDGSVASDRRIELGTERSRAQT
jgi:hypothetical protein